MLPLNRDQGHLKQTPELAFSTTHRLVHNVIRNNYIGNIQNERYHFGILRSRYSVKLPYWGGGISPVLTSKPPHLQTSLSRRPGLETKFHLMLINSNNAFKAADILTYHETATTTR